MEARLKQYEEEYNKRQHNTNIDDIIQFNKKYLMRGIIKVS